ncbi:MAG TPA: SGNH/GDSL hydrolase family protein, partial [Nannocystis sp.]
GATVATTATTTTDPTTATTTTGDDTTGAAEAGTGGTTGGTTTDPDTTTGEDTTGGAVSEPACLFEPFVNKGALAIDYAQFGPVIGSHCKGTNHQDITDIERVVFLGDSVTVGTPPTPGDASYRAELADVLVDRFGLTPPNGLWKQYDPFNGVSVVKDAGDFSSCSEWGARTDDFLAPGTQVDDCFPPDKLDKRTLVVFTMGGNDLAAIAKDGANGKPYDEVVADAEKALLLMREAVQWFVDDPDKFPNGVFVVFANIYEFTDGTGDLMSCPAAGLGGFDKPWEDVEALKQLVLWINEQVMDIAVSTQTDMIFMLENFCGHGFRAGDPTAPCYRGPDSPNYFDVSCIHPTPAGHDVIKDLFTAVIDE